MKLNALQLAHLEALHIADAVHLSRPDPATRREWTWEPPLPPATAPMINSRVLDVLQERRLARWFPTVRDDYPLTGGRMKISPTGKTFLRQLREK